MTTALRGKGPAALGLVLVACGGSRPVHGRGAGEELRDERTVAADERRDGPGDASCDWRYAEGTLASPSFSEEADVSVVPANVDGKPPTDLVARLPSGCGSWGECRHVVLQACGGDRYRAVWGPEYAFDLEVGARSGDALLAPLILHGRTGRAGCDLPTRAVLTWTGDRWRRGPTCAGEGAWDAELCGEPPPPCAEP